MGRGCCVTEEGRRNGEGEGVGPCERKGKKVRRKEKKKNEEGRGVGREGEEKRGK